MIENESHAIMDLYINGLEGWFDEQFGAGLDKTLGIFYYLLADIPNTRSVWVIDVRFELYGQKMKMKQEIPDLFHRYDHEKIRETFHTYVIGPWDEKLEMYNKLIENKTVVLHKDSKDDLIRSLCRNYLGERMKIQCNHI